MSKFMYFLLITLFINYLYTYSYNIYLEIYLYIMVLFDLLACVISATSSACDLWLLNGATSGRAAVYSMSSVAGRILPWGTPLPRGLGCPRKAVFQAYVFCSVV